VDKIAESNLKVIIEIYKERRINTDFINFQERLKGMKKEVEELKKGNPRYSPMIDKIVQEIEKRQTTMYVGYLNRFYLREISKISEMISRLKMFIDASR
jgi:hypothetical protein